MNNETEASKIQSKQKGFIIVAGIIIISISAFYAYGMYRQSNA